MEGSGASSYATPLGGLDGVLLFGADDGTTGVKLWKTDGTEAGTVPVAGIRAVSESIPVNYATLDGFALFTADDGIAGVELWRTDGTEAGTVLIKDIHPGPVGSNPTSLTDLGDRLLFAASGPSGGLEPWVTDGTPEGTLMVQDIIPGPGSSGAGEFTVVGDQIYCSAVSPLTGWELWVLPLDFVLNRPPIALCGDVATSVDDECLAFASVDQGSFDPDGDSITIERSPSGPYELGETVVTLTVTDEFGASDTCVATVTVADTTPPQLLVSLEPDSLWPPNHRMVEVEGPVTVNDNCDTPAVILSSVSSNESDNGQGDGNTINDIQGVETGTGDFEFSLRAERAGGGTGRIYTALYTAEDTAGNIASEAAFSVVPHDQGGIVDPIELNLEQAPTGTLVAWSDAPSAQSYDVILL